MVKEINFIYTPTTSKFFVMQMTCNTVVIHRYLYQVYNRTPLRFWTSGSMQQLTVARHLPFVLPSTALRWRNWICAEHEKISAESNNELGKSNSWWKSIGLKVIASCTVVITVCQQVVEQCIAVFGPRQYPANVLASSYTNRLTMPHFHIAPRDAVKMSGTIKDRSARFICSLHISAGRTVVTTKTLNRNGPNFSFDNPITKVWVLPNSIQWYQLLQQLRFSE